MSNIIERIQKAWNAFRNKDPTPSTFSYYGSGSYYRPDRRTFRPGSERSIITPILNRIAVDCAAVDIRHVKLDDQKRYKEDIEGPLNDLFTLEANIDQTAREFKKDIYASLLDEGYIAVCPIDADVNFSTMTGNNIASARVGKILNWYPKHIDVELYNEETGRRENTRMEKSLCLILQNPFYETMNAPNSLMARLRRKMALLDEIDERNASGKLDMIIQLPYSTRHATQQERAEERRRDIEVQLSGSKYGIAYIDASERVIQLNRSLDNNLQEQIENLTKQLQDQIGVSAEILNGSADEKAETNYINNIIEPLVSTLVDEIKRKWLTKTARTQKQSIMFFDDPFKLIPVSDLAQIADTLTRNAIISSNEMRGIIGFKPSDQADADALVNKNINQPIDPMTGNPVAAETPEGNPEYADIPDEYYK